MYSLIAQYLLRDWELDIRITDVQSLSDLSPQRLAIGIADVQSLSMLSPKRVGIRIPGVQSLSTLSPKRLDIGDSNRRCAIS